MRVLQILPALNHGGVERGTVDLALALKASGHEPYVVSNGGVLVKELEQSQIRHISLPVHKKSLTSLFLIGKLADLLISEKIDVVHARSRIPAWIAYFACKKTGVDFVTTCHGYYSTHFLSKVMGLGKRVIVISKAIGRHMSENFRVPQQRMHLVYRGVDLSKFNFNPDKYMNMDSSRFIITSIGRITTLKGHVDFIRAFHLVSRKYPQSRAWIVGGASGKKGKKLLASLKELVDELGLTNSVEFLGPRNDIPEILAKSSLLILTTRTPEGFGRVIIEAAASGTAVVATRVGGVSEIVDHEENGLLVPPANPVRLSEAIVQLKENPGQCLRFAKSLRVKVENNFSLNKMYEETIRVYENLKQNKKILFFKLGALGDLVLAVPSFRMIKKRFPHSKISLLVDERWSKIVERVPYLDEIIPFKRDELWSSGFRLPGMIRLLRHKGFDISIDFQNTEKTHLLSFLSKIPERYGYKRGLLGNCLNKGIGGFKRVIPPLEHQFELLKPLGVKELDSKLELWPDPSDNLRVDRLLEQSWINQNAFVVGFVLGASSKWVTKRWDIERFIALGDELQRKYQARIVLLGSSADENLAEEYLKYSSRGVINLVGKTSLGELVALVKNLKLLVTPDSAPLHIASATDTPVIALFGPTSPEKHIPPSSQIKVHRKRIECSPCYSGSCSNKDKYLCMKQITVEEVMDSIDQLRKKDLEQKTECSQSAIRNPHIESRGSSV